MSENILLRGLWPLGPPWPLHSPVRRAALVPGTKNHKLAKETISVPRARLQLPSGKALDFPQALPLTRWGTSDKSFLSSGPQLPQLPHLYHGWTGLPGARGSQRGVVARGAATTSRSRAETSAASRLRPGPLAPQRVPARPPAREARAGARLSPTAVDPSPSLDLRAAGGVQGTSHTNPRPISPALSSTNLGLSHLRFSRLRVRARARMCHVCACACARVMCMHAHVHVCACVRMCARVCVHA